MPITELFIGGISGGIAVCGFVWKIHHSLTKRSVEHETRLKDIEHHNDIQNLQIKSIEMNHSNMDVRLLRLEDTCNELKISIAEILQILKQKG
ncbi:TPA: hypothetical protein ACGPGC_003381 [Enterobacter hormaechei]|uniref:hypothetical protein n=1 Tax=Enterobacter cloacae TaxID=550 RepID=UPI0024688E31|nr:hypothetical protein [Enterobacter cloacae]WGL80940.1 hypothetical protein QFB83_15930 [Enterobacter cloacae]